MSLSRDWLNKVDQGFNNRFFIVRHGESEANVSGTISSIYYTSVPNHGLTNKGVEQACDAAGVFYDAAIKHQPTKDILASNVVPSKLLPSTLVDLDQVVFYASDFKRTYETAYYMRESLIYRHTQTKLLRQFERPDLTQVIEDEQLVEDPDVIVSSEERNNNTPGHQRNGSDVSSLSKKSQKFTFPIPSPPGIPLLTTPFLRERYFGSFEGGCPSHDLYSQVWAKDEVEDPSYNAYGSESIQEVVDRVTAFLLEVDRTWKNKIIVLTSHGDVCQILLAVIAAIDPCFHRTLPHMQNCDVRELLPVKGQGYIPEDFIIIEDDEAPNNLSEDLKLNFDLEDEPKTKTPLSSPSNKNKK